MCRERVRTKLEGWEGPFFPFNLYELNTEFNNRDFDLFDLERIGLLIGGRIYVDCEATEDGYIWFDNMYFIVGDAQIIVLFPWRNDIFKGGDISLDRSIALYKKGQLHVRELVIVVQKLCLALHVFVESKQYMHA